MQRPVRRPGPLGVLLLPPTWILLGLALLLYVLGVLLLAFVAVLVATLRLLLGPPLRLLGEAWTGRRAPTLVE